VTVNNDVTFSPRINKALDRLNEIWQSAVWQRRLGSGVTWPGRSPGRGVTWLGVTWLGVTWPGGHLTGGHLAGGHLAGGHLADSVNIIEPRDTFTALQTHYHLTANILLLSSTLYFVFVEKCEKTNTREDSPIKIGLLIIDDSLFFLTFPVFTCLSVYYTLTAIVTQSPSSALLLTPSSSLLAPSP